MVKFLIVWTIWVEICCSERVKLLRCLSHSEDTGPPVSVLFVFTLSPDSNWNVPGLQAAGCCESWFQRVQSQDRPPLWVGKSTHAAFIRGQNSRFEAGSFHCGCLLHKNNINIECEIQGPIFPVWTHCPRKRHRVGCEIAQLLMEWPQAGWLTDDTESTSPTTSLFFSSFCPSSYCCEWQWCRWAVFSLHWQVYPVKGTGLASTTPVYHKHSFIKAPLSLQ